VEHFVEQIKLKGAVEHLPIVAQYVDQQVQVLFVCFVCQIRGNTCDTKQVPAGKRG